MSKIIIISREGQALLIDIGGCTSFKEAIEQLISTFLNANQFWQDQTIDLNFGSLLLNKNEVAQIIALINGVGAQIKHVFARSASTFSALEELQLAVSREANTESTVKVVAEGYNLEVSLSNSGENDKKHYANKETTLVAEKDDSQNNSQVNNSDQATIEKVIVFEDNGLIDKEVQVSEDRLLPVEMGDLSGSTELQTDKIRTKKDVNNQSENKKKNSLYLRQTLRAGQAVSHKGDLIIIGDVNAGAEVMAEGDITIWGSLRGIAHAGTNGNTKAEIRALRLQPIQIRIADAIARSPDSGKHSASQNPRLAAETAKLVNGKIRLLQKNFDG